MGSGKSTIGAELARKFNMPFIDLDVLIEKKSGKTISDIFGEIGENSFRVLERESLLQILEKENTVIALGGGTPCFYDNMELIKESGCTIYLKVPAYVLEPRLSKEISKRPLLQDMNPPEMMEFIQQQIGDREKFYLYADMINTGENISVLIDKIIEYRNKKKA